MYTHNGSLGIAPTRNCIYFLKIGFVVAGGGCYSFYMYHGNISDKESKLQEEKDLLHILKYGCNSVWVQFHVYHLHTYNSYTTSPLYYTLKNNTVQGINCALCLHYYLYSDYLWAGIEFESFLRMN